MDNFELFPLFSCPIYKSKVSLTGVELEFAKSLEFYRTTNNSCNLSHDTSVLTSEHLSYLKPQVDEHINNYCRTVLKIKNNMSVHMSASWVVEVLPNDYAVEHVHGNSVFSGVLYLQTQPEGGEISFVKDNNSGGVCTTTINLEHDEWNLYNAREWWFTPQVGDILLFPSHVRHKIMNNKSSHKRYSLAFNLFFKGSFGYDTNILTL